MSFSSWIPRRERDSNDVKKVEQANKTNRNDHKTKRSDLLGNRRGHVRGAGQSHAAAG